MSGVHIEVYEVRPEASRVESRADCGCSWFMDEPTELDASGGCGPAHRLHKHEA